MTIESNALHKSIERQIMTYFNLLCFDHNPMSGLWVESRNDTVEIIYSLILVYCAL